MDRVSNVIIAIKQKLEPGLSGAGNVLTTIVDVTTSSQKKLNDAQEEGAKKSRGLGASFVDMAAKLYLVKEGLDFVIASLSLMYETAKQGAVIEQTANSFERIMDVMGGSREVIDQMIQASHGLLTEFEAMGMANQALAGAQGEFKEKLYESLPALVEVARASAILNPQYGDTSQQLERIIMAMKKRQPALLDEIGMEILLRDVNREYANSLGITTEALTSQQSQMALLNEVLERGGSLIEIAGTESENTLDSFSRFETQAKTLGETISTQSVEPVVKFIASISGLMEVTNKFIKENPKFVEAITEMGIRVSTLGLSMWIAQAQEMGLLKVTKDTTKEIENSSDATKKLDDMRGESIDLIHEEIDALKKSKEAYAEFVEKRDKQTDDLFLDIIKHNQKIIEAEKDRDDKVIDLTQDHNERMNDLVEDAAADRTRIEARAAQDRLDIEQDYQDQKAGLEKDLAELRMELEGRNPFVDQATTDAIKNQEALLKATKSNLEGLKRDAKNGHAGPSMDKEIQDTEDLIRRTEEDISRLKDEAREQERVGRIQERIREKEQALVVAAQERDEELRLLEDKTQKELTISREAEAQKSADMQEEYKKRRGAIVESFEEIRIAAEEKLRLETVDAMLSIVDAESKIGQELMNTKLKMLGASDEMISKYYQIRNAIVGENGVLSAIQQLNALAFSSSAGYYNYSSGRHITGGRAAGGSVESGHSYLVGEQGPEILTMGGNGNITPNHALGGGGLTINVSAGAFLGNRSDAVAFANMVGPLVADWQSRYGGATNAQGTRNIRSSR